MAGYTRQSTYTDGDVIQASDSNNEFDQLLDVFNNSTGHAHDGTPAEGPVIGLIGDAGLVTPLNKVAVDTVNNRLSFYIDVASASTEQLRVEDGIVYPVTTNDVDLGTTLFMFKDGFFAGTLESVNLEVTNIKAKDGTASASIADSTGVFTITSAVLTTADINGGTIDGTTIGATTPAAITGTTITGTTITGTSFVTSGDMTFGDNDKAIFGAGSDLQIYHDGSHSYISEVGQGNMRIVAANFELRNSGNTERMILAEPDAGVSLYYDNVAKLATTSTGIDVTGTVTADGLTVDGDATISSASPTLNLTDTGGVGTATINANLSNVYYTTPSSSRGHYFKTNAGSNDVLSITGGGDISFYEDTGTTAKLIWDASDEALEFGDSVKATFGAGSDLEILHNGIDSYINDVGTGRLYIRGNDSVRIQATAGSENMGVFNQNGSVDLYYDNALKLATTSTGIDVTGSLDVTDAATTRTNLDVDQAGTALALAIALG